MPEADHGVDREMTFDRVLRAVATVAVVALLGACTTNPVDFVDVSPANPAPPPAPVAPEVRLVGAIEASGCSLTPANSGSVLLRANLTQAQLAGILPGLVETGRVEVAGSDSFRVLTDRCV